MRLNIGEGNRGEEVVKMFELVMPVASDDVVYW